MVKDRAERFDWALVKSFLAVLDAGDQSRWVGLTGVVETVVDDLTRARDDICELAVRYGDPNPASIAAFRSQPRISFRIRIIAIHDHLDK